MRLRCLLRRRRERHALVLGQRLWRPRRWPAAQRPVGETDWNRYGLACDLPWRLAGLCHPRQRLALLLRLADERSPLRRNLAQARSRPHLAVTCFTPVWSGPAA